MASQQEVPATVKAITTSSSSNASYSTTEFDYSVEVPFCAVLELTTEMRKANSRYRKELSEVFKDSALSKAGRRATGCSPWLDKAMPPWPNREQARAAADTKAACVSTELVVVNSIVRRREMIQAVETTAFK